MNIREARQKLKITQKELADLSGVKQSYISALESGKRPHAPKARKKVLNSLIYTAQKCNISLVNYDRQIINEIYKILENYGADAGLLGTVGSWKDSLPDADVLANLRAYSFESPTNAVPNAFEFITNHDAELRGDNGHN